MLITKELLNEKEDLVFRLVFVFHVLFYEKELAELVSSLFAVIAKCQSLIFNEAL